MKQFFKKWEKYSNGELTDSDNPQYRSIFDNIKSISTLDPIDRKGPKLKSEQLKEEENYWIDIELWFANLEIERKRRQNDLEKVVGERGRITDDYIGDSLHLLRAEVDGYALKELLKQEIVSQIEFPPKLKYESIKSLKTSLNDINIGKPSKEANGICIIDSGVVPEHDLVEKGLIHYDVFRDDLENGIDENGHGTFVAGIALYNDVRKCIDKKEFIPEVKLYSARVTDESNSLGPSEKLYIKQIKKAIEYYNDNFNCRVFNISLGDPDSIFVGEQYQTPWAHVLDNLARERDIIIIIPTGNLNKNHFDGLEVEREKITHNYPQYLFKDSAGLLDPATATNCITVGSISNELRTSRGRGFGNSDEKSRGVHKIKIADINHPSPFTRTGLGINDTIKPEFVAEGGNMYFDGMTNNLVSDNVETGVFSLNSNFISEGRFFSCGSGTSYSAPIVANLAARILNIDSELSSNTIRALLANSAIRPSKTCNKLNKYLEKVQSECIEILKKEENNADEEFKKIIEECIERGYINTKSKKRLLKNDNCSKELKRLLKVTPGDTRTGCSTEFYEYFLRVSGYGIPNFDRAVYSSDSKVTMYSENEIGIDEFQVYEISVPKSFTETKGIRKIIVSLAFSPPTRNTRKNYCGYSLNFELIRGKKLEDVLKIASNENKDEKYSELGAERCDLEPKKSLRGNSTLQRAEFIREQRNSQDYGNTYYLVVESKDNWIENSVEFSDNIKENYSVVVTLEHENEEVEIYEDIRQHIENKIQEQVQQGIREKVRI